MVHLLARLHKLDIGFRKDSAICLLQTLEGLCVIQGQVISVVDGYHGSLVVMHIKIIVAIILQVK
jgi:hypothetical protein